MGRDEARFMAKVNKESGCWLWTGADSGASGYGKFSIQGNSVSAHRWAYQEWVGAIPDGYWIDHLCRNRACVNPDHLESVPPGVNTERGLLGFGLDGRCRSGLHDITDPSNVYVRPSSGRRRCVACHREATRAARLMGRVS